jgi:hypothetical protein
VEDQLLLFFVAQFSTIVGFEVVGIQGQGFFD